MTRMHKATQLMWIERSSKCMGRAGADREVVLEECSSVRGFWDEHRHDDVKPEKNLMYSAVNDDQGTP